MTNMKLDYRTLNNIRKVPVFVLRVLLYPIKIVFILPLWFLMGFVDTDWENEEERALFWKLMRKAYTF